MTTHARHSLAIATIALGVALCVSACGGSSSPKSRSTGQRQTRGGIAQQAFAFVACMRAHGSPNMPDPVVSTSNNGGTVVQIRAVQHVGPGQPKAIPKACRGILPSPQNQSPQQQAAQDQARRAGLLSFAACMRAHGVASFPDPTSQGQLTLQMVTGAGIDLHATATLAAVKACEGASHGIITPSVVAQALQQTATSSG
jgi:hypothetical protein